MEKIELDFWRTAEALYEIDNTANTRESNEMDKLQVELSKEMLCCVWSNFSRLLPETSR